MDSALLEKSVEHTIEKLNKLKINEKLAAELKWCLGSYRFDHNPDGLKMKSMLALELLKEVQYCKQLLFSYNHKFHIGFNFPVKINFGFIFT